MLNKIFFVLMFLGFFSNSISAADSIKTKITRVSTSNAGDSIIIETEDPASTSKILMKKDTNLLFDENLSILLSAFHSDSKVLVYTEGCEISSHIAFKSISVIK